MKIGDEEYYAKLKKYFEQVGPNPGTNMASKWAWSLSKEKEFKKVMAEKGELQAEKSNSKLP
jgi:hypothetical protein